MSDSNATTGILAIQRVMACAAPSGWRDAIVVSAAAGSVELVTLDGETRRVASFAPVRSGEPVALHPVAEVLAVGEEWYPAR